MRASQRRSDAARHATLPNPGISARIGNSRPTSAAGRQLERKSAECPSRLLGSPPDHRSRRRQTNAYSPDVRPLRIAAVRSGANSRPPDSGAPRREDFDSRPPKASHGTDGVFGRTTMSIRPNFRMHTPSSGCVDPPIIG